MKNNKIQLEGVISLELEGRRLDQALAKLFPQYSRAQLQTWIRAGAVEVDDQIQTLPREKVFTDQKIKIIAHLKADERWEAQPLSLNIIYEDEALIIINKLAGMVVHPGAGVRNNTLANALLHHAPELATVPRSGIIHRLDKDTTGLLVIARSLESHHVLIKQMSERAIKREYEAIVNGVMVAGGTIETDIGRHPTHRTKMAVVTEGRKSITHYRVKERFRAHTYIRVMLETGRTHQIRVHMAHIHYPLVGDPLYGRKGIPAKLSEPLKEALQNFKRQALHAAKLTLTHPNTGKEMTWEAPLPKDMAHLLTLLREEPHEPKAELY
ncbi:23S rRNA pseudouridine(1911/1915/1917) synthase RluD [Candidiatus Paracoxiella cheracis]|uniref:23S rRNA pseudouridine(1911/1915/1917) synthase RluD n=1 Tax=Candidiatus Paracoxiella cheracis TaxID=3405120 RepID=UPI003BF56B6B